MNIKMFDTAHPHVQALIRSVNDISKVLYINDDYVFLKSLVATNYKHLHVDPLLESGLLTKLTNKLINYLIGKTRYKNIWIIDRTTFEMLISNCDFETQEKYLLIKKVNNGNT